MAANRLITAKIGIWHPQQTNFAQTKRSDCAEQDPRFLPNQRFPPTLTEAVMLLRPTAICRLHVHILSLPRHQMKDWSRAVTQSWPCTSARPWDWITSVVLAVGKKMWVPRLCIPICNGWIDNLNGISIFHRMVWSNSDKKLTYKSALLLIILVQGLAINWSVCLEHLP